MQQNSSRNVVGGIILIGLGILFFLNNYNVSIGDWFILGVGIIFITAYITKKKTGFLITGLILSYFGSLILLQSLNVIDQQFFGALFLTVLGVAFLTVYFMKKKVGFIFPGFILPVLGIYGLVLRTFNVDQSELWPLIFMMLALSFLLIFIFEFKSLRYRPLIPALILFGVGVVGFMTVRGMIDMDTWFDVFRIVGDFWPLLLVIAGVLILFKGPKTK